MDSGSGWPRGDRIGRGRRRTGGLPRRWPRKYRGRRQRVDRAGRLSGIRSDRFPAADTWRGIDECRSARRRHRSRIGSPFRGADVTPLGRVAMIGNSLPRRCGIATFTTDLQRAISDSRPNLTAAIVAMTDHGQTYDYPSSVALQIKDDSIEAYVRAAAFLNAGRFDIACLQHEFGIFGGEAGCHILELLSRLTMPVVTTLHTVLAHPTAAQHAVMDRIVAMSAKIVVMANKGH